MDGENPILPKLSGFFTDTSLSGRMAGFSLPFFPSYISGVQEKSVSG
jgi:hypothetical protein